MKTVLFYIHDPMCSWCWGFSEVKRQLFKALPAHIEIHRLLGGLAADNEQPMTVEMQQHLQRVWQRIEEKIPGMKFNFNFWQNCQPRRSTYPACRAVIAARMQGDEFDEMMTARIQQAYYQQALNPSDRDTLVDLAAEIGLERHLFSRDLDSDATQQTLLSEIELSRKLHADSFPSLVLKIGNSAWPIAIDYLDSFIMLESIEMLLSAGE